MRRFSAIYLWILGLAARASFKYSTDGLKDRISRVLRVRACSWDWIRPSVANAPIPSKSKARNQRLAAPLFSCLSLTRKFFLMQTGYEQKG